MNNVYYVGSGELTFSIIERIINENLKLELAPKPNSASGNAVIISTGKLRLPPNHCMASLPVSVRCAVKTYRPMNSTPCKRIL